MMFTANLEHLLSFTICLKLKTLVKNPETLGITDLRRFLPGLFYLRHVVTQKKALFSPVVFKFWWSSEGHFLMATLVFLLKGTSPEPIANTGFFERLAPLEGVKTAQNGFLDVSYKRRIQLTRCTSLSLTSVCLPR